MRYVVSSGHRKNGSDLGVEHVSISRVALINAKIVRSRCSTKSDFEIAPVICTDASIHELPPSVLSDAKTCWILDP